MPKAPSQQALAIYAKITADTSFGSNASKMTYEAPKGFWENENYTSIDITINLKNMLKMELPLFGLYGMEDGLYATDQITQLKKILPVANFRYIQNCSHNVFIDQQDIFVTTLKNWIR